LTQRSDEVYWDETASELNHLGPADGRLQPLSVVVRGVPVIDRRVISAERELEIVVEVVADDQALDFDIKPRSGRRPGSGIATRGERDLAEETNLGGESRDQMQRRLPELESAMAGR
jgi:hypothetical protein